MLELYTNINIKFIPSQYGNRESFNVLSQTN